MVFENISKKVRDGLGFWNFSDSSVFLVTVFSKNVASEIDEARDGGRRNELNFGIITDWTENDEKLLKLLANDAMENLSLSS